MERVDNLVWFPGEELNLWCDPICGDCSFGWSASIFIQSMNNSPKPSLCRVLNSNVQLTLLDAFSASDDTIFDIFDMVFRGETY